MTTGRTVDLDVGPVRVHEAGTGPAVLMLHGSGPGTTGAGAWTTTMQALAGRHHLVAPDQAGFGRTPLPPGSRGGAACWTAQAAALMDALGHTSYAVVGHSMGGAIALSLAAARPDAVSRVVAVGTMGTPGAPLTPDLDALWAAPPTSDGARDMLERLVLDRSLVSERAVAARAEAMRAGADAFARLFPPPRDRWVDDLALTDDALAAVRAPVLLVHGAEDRVTPLETAALPLLRRLHDVRLHVLGRCGHAPAVERPEAFQRLVGAFLTDGA